MSKTLDTPFFSCDIELNNAVNYFYNRVSNLEILPSFSIRKNMPTKMASCQYWRPLFVELCRTKHISSKKKYYCIACGLETEPELSHIIPRIYGGKGDVINVIPLCHICHRTFDKKYDISPYDKFEIIDFFHWIIDNTLVNVVTQLAKKHYFIINSLESLIEKENITPKIFISLFSSEIKEYVEKSYPIYKDG